MNATTEKLLTIKELAAELRRSYGYVLAMRARGFRMPGNRATLQAALEWLEEHPSPRGVEKEG